MNSSHLTLLNQARQNASQGNPEKAMALFKKLLETSRNDKEVQATAYFEIGKVYTDINKDDVAVKFFKKAISIDPQVLIQEFDWFQDLKRRNKKHIFDELERTQSEFKDYLMDQTKDIENERPSYTSNAAEQSLPVHSSRSTRASSTQTGQGGWQENSETIRLAGFWKRLIAFIVDSIIIILVSAVLLMILRYGFGVSSLFIIEPQVFAIWYIIVIMSLWLYYAIMESSRCQGTLGKMLLGIYITDEQGQRIGVGRASGRYFLKALLFTSLLLGLVDCLMVAVTEKKQAWHDMPVGCLVISKQ